MTAIWPPECDPPRHLARIEDLPDTLRQISGLIRITLADVSDLADIAAPCDRCGAPTATLCSAPNGRLLISLSCCGASA